MSLQSELTRLRANVLSAVTSQAAILSVIASKGVTVPPGATLHDVPGLIGQIAGMGPVGHVAIGGRTYKTVKIGTQEWLAENLDWKWTNLTVGGSWTTGSAHAWYPNNDETTYGWNGYKCGLLYNGFAMKYLHDNSTSLLPDGWRVPSLSDFENLSTHIGNDSEFTQKVKAIDNSVAAGFPSGWNGTDNYGFGILPAGVYWQTFSSIGTKSQIWTSTATDTVNTDYAIYFRVVSNSLESDKDGFDAAMSLRLVKDVS